MFLDSLDIANRSCQHCGVSQIDSPTEDSKANKEISFTYDKVRRAELQRNTWGFAVKKAVLRPVDTTTYLLSPPLYSASATYLRGAIVQDTNGVYWMSKIVDNINNAPGGNNESWDAYFGPRTVSLWVSTTAYSAGELVYVAGTSAGSYTVFMSLTNGNSDTPNTANAWDATVTYRFDQVVSYSGSQWRSLIALNLNVTPADGPLPFDATATYSTGQQVTASDQFIYTSASNGNIGHDPTTDGGVHWTATNIANGWSRTPTILASATSWLPISTAALADLSVLYPIGAGPASQTFSRNIYHLPAGYLKEAPQYPKLGSYSMLGAPSGMLYSDWEFDDDYIVTACVDPIVFRFVADITVVREMHDMFCEGLAARIAVEVCEPLTQSNSKIQTIAAAYTKFMSEARTNNAIEQGAEEPPMDDWITCRG